MNVWIFLWYDILNIKVCKLKNKYVYVYKIKGCMEFFIFVLDWKYEIVNGNYDLYN